MRVFSLRRWSFVFFAAFLPCVVSAQVLAEKQVLRGLVYARVGDVELKLDLHLPLKAHEPLPVILWMHPLGGGRGFCPIANLAKEGFAVASISYRVIGQAPFPAQIEDCKSAVRWLRAHAADYNLDASHVGACGESAGGFLASLLGTTGETHTWDSEAGGNPELSSRVQAVVALCPPTDFSGMVTSLRERSFWANLFTSGNPRTATYTFARNRTLEKLFGGPLREREKLVRRASPVANVSADDAPFLLFHGRNDPLVPLSQSENFLRVLQGADVEARLCVVETRTHGFGRFSPEMMAETRAFFIQHLR